MKKYALFTLLAIAIPTEAQTTQKNIWSRMDSVVGNPKKNLTGFEWLWSYFTHSAHHRGQAEVYLRLKGIKPPVYAF